MLSLWRNLMIRRGMIPRSEGLRLHFINNRALGLFLRVAASSNIAFEGYNTLAGIIERHKGNETNEDVKLIEWALSAR